MGCIVRTTKKESFGRKLGQLILTGRPGVKKGTGIQDFVVRHGDLQ